MLYWLTALSDGGDFFNLFRYITFRAGGAFMTALIFGFLFGPPLINVLRRTQGKGQPIRTDGPESHFIKAGTPTMGGLLIVGALLSSTLLWALAQASQGADPAQLSRSAAEAGYDLGPIRGMLDALAGGAG